MNIKPQILQFELWQECNTHCPFCFLTEENTKYTPKERKITSCHKVLEKISDESIYNQYDTLSFIGGEFFQGQINDVDVHKAFFNLFAKVAELYNRKVIKGVWLCATLAIGNQKDLYDLLDLFDDLDNFWILTSWDTLGRFRTPKMFNTWHNNMISLHKTYPTLKFNITTILTGDLIEKYLNNEINFSKMMDLYHCTFFFKQCSTIVRSESLKTMSYIQCKQYTNDKLGNFFPTRKNFIKFLIKYRETESSHMWEKLFNVKFRADDIYRNYNSDLGGGYMELNHRSKNDKWDQHELSQSQCGHTIVYQAYLDCDECVMCDKEMIEKMF